MPEPDDLSAGMRVSGPPPYPDPTTLTTEALRRDLTALKDLLRAEMHGEHEAIVERFEKVKSQFETLEKQRVEQKVDAQTGLAAALSAAEKAVGAQTAASERAIAKSEGTTNEQLKALGNTFATSIAGITRSLDDQKERINSLELRLTSRLDAAGGVTAGQAELRVTNRADTSLYVAVAVGALLLISTIATVIAFIIHG